MSMGCKPGGGIEVARKVWTKKQPQRAGLALRTQDLKRAPGRATDDWTLRRFAGGRFLTGITNFSPDQTSFTAQTLMSTRPALSPASRITFSVRSVETPELFLGQEIHSIPAGASAFAAAGNSSSSAARDLVNRKMKSKSLFLLARDCSRHFSSAPLISTLTSSGRCRRATRKSSLMPSFFASGVPEYPAIAKNCRVIA